MEKIKLLWTKNVDKQTEQYIGENFRPKHEYHELPGVIHPYEPTPKEADAENKPNKISVEGYDNTHGCQHAKNRPL